MPQLSNFQVGDALVRFSSLYRITKIKDNEKDEDKVLYFEPLYKNNRNETLVCSIPVKNLERTNIRKPLSEKELKKLFKQLKKKTVESVSYKRNFVRKRLNENEPKELVNILKNLWIEKVDEDRNFTVTKRNLFNSALKKFAQEVAFVKDISPEEAKEMILDTLKDTGEYKHI